MRLQRQAGRWNCQSAAQGPDVLLAVHNGGRPIPSDALATIFDPLVRGPSPESPKQRQAGSIGLGLYVAREVAIAHGGAIDVKSSAANGTIFTVRSRADDQSDQHWPQLRFPVGSVEEQIRPILNWTVSRAENELVLPHRCKVPGHFAESATADNRANRNAPTGWSKFSKRDSVERTPFTPQGRFAGPSRICILIVWPFPSQQSMTPDCALFE